MPKKGKYAFNSSIPLSEEDAYTYEATLNGLPEEEWVFSYVSTESLIFGTNETYKHVFLVFLTALIMGGIGWVLHSRLGLRWVRSLALVAIILYIVYFTRNAWGHLLLGYYFAFLILWPVFVITLIMLLICIYKGMTRRG